MIDQWMIRTAENWIAGPYLREQVCKMILERKLALEDEVCSANGYWIYLHEREEILRHLGVEVPQAPHEAGEEITETQTQTIEDSTDPALHETVERLQRLEDGLIASSTENTAVIDTASLRSPAKRKEDPKRAEDHKKKEERRKEIFRIVAKPLPQIEVKGHIEAPSLWKGFVWVLLAATGLVLLLMIRLLKP
jgi:hypothetical protein